MYRLFLLRHAEAGKAESGEDKDRPLSVMGKQHADALASFLVNENLQPDKILCSAALRTRQTVAPILKKMPDIDISVEDDLYLAATGRLFDFVSACDSDTARLMIVAHNPGILSLVSTLTGQAHADEAFKLQGGFGPGNLAIIDFETPWPDIQPGSGMLARVVTGEEVTATG